MPRVEAPPLVQGDWHETHRLTPRERAEQAAARAVLYLERYFCEDRRTGERRNLEAALEALREALEAA